MWGSRLEVVRLGGDGAAPCQGADLGSGGKGEVGGPLAGGFEPCAGFAAVTVRHDQMKGVLKL